MNAKKILKTVIITVVIFLITLIITLIPLLIWVAKQPAATEETVTEQMVETKIDAMELTMSPEYFENIS